ncbi:MAG: DNA polymerase III subunit beta [Candidatus Campbellbacteria bacterium]|nr:DNA polymerase III subunit beta [Candidatus Campbellbacteria bacterium]
MKIECVQTKLADALRKTERIAGKHASLPILSSVLLEAKDGILLVKSTNLELGIEISLPVKVEKEGVVAISAQSLASYVSSLRGKSITLESEDKTLLVASEKQHATFNTFDHSEFPTIPRIKGTSVHFSAEKLRAGIKSVVYSASVSSVKPELSSVYISGTDDNNLVFVATDSFRLAEKKLSEKEAHSVEPVLVPQKNVLEIERILEGVDGEVEMIFGDNQIAIVDNSFYITSRIVDGVFPDYAKIIPEGYSTKVTVLKQDLIDAFKVSTIFSGKTNQVTFDIDPEKNLMILETRSSEVGENKAELDVTAEGEPLSVNFNYRYITDSFQAIPEESVELLFNGVSRPLVVRGVGSKDFTYIVMPMNK